MSYNSLNAQSRDQALAERVNACGNQEARDNPNLSGTSFAKAIANGVMAPVSVLMWPVCLATEDQYASALAAEHPDPGGDESVIPDAMILSAVQASWPATWPPEM